MLVKLTPKVSPGREVHLNDVKKVSTVRLISDLKEESFGNIDWKRGDIR